MFGLAPKRMFSLRERFWIQACCATYATLPDLNQARIIYCTIKYICISIVKVASPGGIDPDPSRKKLDTEPGLDPNIKKIDPTKFRTFFRYRSQYN